MIYTEDMSFAFVHVPKCAGWSVKRWMMDNLGPIVVPAGDPQLREWENASGLEGLPRGHIRVADWPEFHPEGLSASDFGQVIAVIRDPVMHALSQWAFWRMSWIEGRLRMPQHAIAAQHTTLEGWLENPRHQYHIRYDYLLERPPLYRGDDSPGYESHGGYFKYWLAVDGAFPENLRICHLSSLADDLAEVLPGDVEPVPLERLNASGSEKRTAELTDRAREIIAREYAWASGYYEMLADEPGLSGPLCGEGLE